MIRTTLVALALVLSGGARASITDPCPDQPVKDVFIEKLNAMDKTTQVLGGKIAELTDAVTFDYNPLNKDTVCYYTARTAEGRSTKIKATYKLHPWGFGIIDIDTR